MRVWNSDIPRYQRPNYIIPPLQSMNRVSIGVSLLTTREQGLTFKTAQGYGAFVHMLTTATAAQTTLIFSQTNINLSMWSGYNNSRDDVFSTLYMRNLISMATNDIARYTSYISTLNSWGNWDGDLLTEYFWLDPFNDINWLSYPPPTPSPYSTVVKQDTLPHGRSP